MFLKCWVMQVFYMYIDTSSHNLDIFFKWDRSYGNPKLSTKSNISTVYCKHFLKF